MSSEFSILMQDEHVLNHDVASIDAMRSWTKHKNIS